jgi:hypothetical protein
MNTTHHENLPRQKQKIRCQFLRAAATRQHGGQKNSEQHFLHALVGVAFNYMVMN